MATGLTNPQEIPYPLSDDPVNVHSDMQEMAERVNDLLTALQVPYLSLDIKNVSGATLTKGTPVYITGYSSGRATVEKCEADDINTFPCVGLIKAQVLDGQEGVLVTIGVLENVDTSSYSEGDKLYVASAGGLTNTQPTGGSGVIGVVSFSDATGGKILVSPIKGGNATWGAVKNGL
jgi:uncharacterized protein (UPF0297 family)